MQQPKKDVQIILDSLHLEEPPVDKPAFPDTATVRSWRRLRRCQCLDRLRLTSRDGSTCAQPARQHCFSSCLGRHMLFRDRLYRPSGFYSLGLNRREILRQPKTQSGRTLTRADIGQHARHKPSCTATPQKADASNILFVEADTSTKCTANLVLSDTTSVFRGAFLGGCVESGASNSVIGRKDECLYCKAAKVPFRLSTSYTTF